MKVQPREAVLVTIFEGGLHEMMTSKQCEESVNITRASDKKIKAPSCNYIFILHRIY